MQMQMSVRPSTRAVGAVLGLLVMCVSVPSAEAAGPPVPPSQARGVATSSSTSAAPGAKTPTVSPRAAVRYGWGKVVAGDEFNYQGRPDRRKWRVYDSRGHAGKGWRRPSAWHVNGATATVTGNTRGTTGGMAALHGQRYGRWEARMRTSRRDPKYHPNILLWPHARGTRNCPEVNFAESTNNPKLAKFFLHYGCHNQGLSRARKAADMTAWHNYAVEWTATQVTGYIDGRVWFRDRNRGHVPQVAMHATLQLDWMPNSARTRRTTMSVDWIRVYRAR